MTKDQINTLADSAGILTSVASPLAGGVIDLVIREAALLIDSGEMTEADLADVKARAQLADDEWDAVVAKAKSK